MLIPECRIELADRGQGMAVGCMAENEGLPAKRNSPRKGIMAPRKTGWAVEICDDNQSEEGSWTDSGMLEGRDMPAKIAGQGADALIDKLDAFYQADRWDHTPPLAKASPNSESGLRSVKLMIP